MYIVENVMLHWKDNENTDDIFHWSKILLSTHHLKQSDNKWYANLFDMNPKFAITKSKKLVLCVYKEQPYHALLTLRSARWVSQTRMFFIFEKNTFVV